MNSQNTMSSSIYVGSFIHSVSLEKLEFVEHGIIVVSKGKIALVQHTACNLSTIQKSYDVANENVHRLKKGQFLIPGFIDTHIHGSQYPNVGLGYDLPLLDWLQTYTFPLEEKFSDSGFAEKVYDGVVAKTLANGTTTACYFATIHKQGSCILAECARKLGQRAFIGKVNMNINPRVTYRETFQESVDETIDFVEKILEMNDPLVKPIITPRFALSCDMNLMEALGQIATDYDLPIQTHVSENLEEVSMVKKEFPDYKNYVDVYSKAGLLTRKTILAHGIYLEPDEINVIRKTQATVAHCPESNNLLQSGICPVRKYLDAGLKISLGTDCSGGSSCSILNTIRQTLLASINASFAKMGTKLSHEEVFYMATLGGAEALYLQNETGNFMPGKYFDAILVDLNDLDLLEEYNLHQLFQKFIYLGDDRMMKKVFVAGRIVKELSNDL